MTHSINAFYYNSLCYKVILIVLNRADKIPAALYTSYTESCQRETYRRKEGASSHQFSIFDDFSVN